MISKNDVVLLLTDLQDSGIDVGNSIIELFKAQNIPLSVLKFINSHRQLDLTTFYEHLRKSYNHKKSKLYINILKEVEDPDEVVSTLSAYQLQAILFSRRVENPQMFLEHARVREVNTVLSKYLIDFDLSTCVELMRLIKADLLACEIISGRRDQEEENS